MAKPRKSIEFAHGRRPATAAASADPLPARTAEVHARYDEYLRLLDDVPVLLDVVSAPPRTAIRDFRLGQRPNVRKAAREDAYTVREQHLAEREGAYAEYVLRCGDDAMPAMLSASRPPARKKKSQPSHSRKRSKRRKR